VDKKMVITKKPVQLKAADIIKAISYDPAWALSVKTPVEIIDFVNLENSKITHLSELISFKGKNNQGFCASFKNCKNLKVPLGTFFGGVNFTESGIETLPNDPKNFSILGKTRVGLSADFSRCKSLELATGVFPGAVRFCESSITDICNLEVKGSIDPNLLTPVGAPRTKLNIFCASFFNCEHLLYASGTFHGLADFSGSGVNKIDQDLKILRPNELGEAAKFDYCKDLLVVKGNFPGYVSLAFSAVQAIDQLTVQKPNILNKKLCILGCEDLKTIPPKFKLDEVIADDSFIKKQTAKEDIINKINKSGILSL
jgi:hypothetical protein